MENSWAFVTGISEGVGKSVAIKLSKENYSIIGLSRSRPKYLSDYPNIHWFSFDLSKTFKENYFESSIKNLTNRNRLIILNAAIAHYGKLLDLDYKKLKGLINTNLLSSIQVLKYLLPLMEENGQVIFLGSSAEYLPAPNMGMYAALKVAQSHLAITLNVRISLTKHKI